MRDSIETKELKVTLQKNGMIRTESGLLIARLVDDIEYGQIEKSQADVVLMPFKALAYGARFKFRNCKDGKTWIKMFDNTICEYNKDYINHKNWLGQQIALADFDDITEFVA